MDYRSPLFAEQPDLALPAYMLIVSFGLIDITSTLGPIEIAPGTHRMPRLEAMRAVESGEIELLPVPLDMGDVCGQQPGRKRNPDVWQSLPPE